MGRERFCSVLQRKDFEINYNRVFPEIDHSGNVARIVLGLKFCISKDLIIIKYIIKNFIKTFTKSEANFYQMFRNTNFKPNAILATLPE